MFRCLWLLCPHSHPETLKFKRVVPGGLWQGLFEQSFRGLAAQYVLADELLVPQGVMLGPAVSGETQTETLQPKQNHKVNVRIFFLQ